MTTESLDDDREEEPPPFLERATIALCCILNAVVGFYFFGNLVCGLESPEVIPPGLIWAALPVAGWSVLASVGLALAYGLLRWVRFQRGPDARWRNAQCPACGHPMPPKLAGPICAECGGELARPVPPPSPAPRLAVRFLVAAAGGALVSLLWLGADVYRFRLEVAVDPAQPVRRARAWPFGSAGLTYEPLLGFKAHD